MKVCHIADIHVKDGRREEYAAAFAELLSQLREARPAAVVLAGDIFDTMTRASPANWNDVATLLQNLGEVAPVVAIPGNHDMNVRARTATDLLTPLFKSAGGARNLDPTRVCLWTEPGVYEHPQLPGVRWVIGPPGYDLPDPSALGDLGGGPVVAVFHDTISGCRYPNGQVAEVDRFTPSYVRALASAVSPRPLAVMLGDVHLQQEVQIPDAPNVRCAYPGSLVCQNLGEPHLGHGWLCWDLEQDADGAPTYEPREVPNPQAMYTAHIAAGADETAEPRPERPTVWRLRADAATTSAQVEAHVERLQARHGRPPRDVQHSAPVGAEAAPVGAAPVSDTAAPVGAAPAPMGAAPAPLGDASAEMAAASDWLAEHTNDEQLARAVRESHRKALSTQQQPTAARPILTRLEFSNLYCYGEGNTADFAAIQAGPPGLIGLTAPNASGKSSLLDILFLAMTGQPMRGRKIRAQREGADRCELVLDFKLDGRPGRVSTWRKANHQSMALEYDGEDLTCKTLPETTERLRHFFGDAKHIARVSMYRPGHVTDFMHLEQQEQDEVLTNLLAMGHHKQIKKVLDRQYVELRATVRAIQSTLEDAMPGVASAKDTQAKRLAAIVGHMQSAYAASPALLAEGKAARAASEAADAARETAAAALAAAAATLEAFAPCVSELEAYEPAAEAAPFANLQATLHEFTSLGMYLSAQPNGVAFDAGEDLPQRADCEAREAEASAASKAAAAAAAVAEAAARRCGAECADLDPPPPETAELASSATGVPLQAVVLQRDALAAAIAGLGGRPQADVPAAERAAAAAAERAAAAAHGLRHLERAAPAADARYAQILARAPPRAAAPPCAPSGRAPQALAAHYEHVTAGAFRAHEAALDSAATAEDLGAAREEARRRGERHAAAQTAACRARYEAEAAGTSPDSPEPQHYQQEVDAQPGRTSVQILASLPSKEEIQELKGMEAPAKSAAELEAQCAAQEKGRASGLLAADLHAKASGRDCEGCASVRAYVDIVARHAAASPVTLGDVGAAREAERKWALRARVAEELREYNVARAYEQRAAGRARHSLWVQAKGAEAAEAEARAGLETAAAAARGTESSISAREKAEAVYRDLADIAAAHAQVEGWAAALEEARTEQASAQGAHAEASRALAAARGTAEAEGQRKRLAELEAAAVAEAARERLERHASASAEVRTRLSAHAAQTTLESAEASTRRRVARDAHEASEHRRARRAELGAGLSAARATASAAEATARAAHVARAAESAAARATLEIKRAQWQRTSPARAHAQQHKKLTAAQGDLAVVALHRAMLDPAKGIAPRMLETARIEFARETNARLTAAAATFGIARGAEGYELTATGAATPPSRDPALTSGYQSFVLELAARAALEAVARVPLPSVLCIDEGFGCLDGAHLATVAESLRSLAADARPGAHRPLVLAVTHREDLTPAFAQRLTLDSDPARPTALRWGGAPRNLMATGSVANPAGASSPELRDGRCTACDKPVPPGAPNWAAHCETPGHAAWTDPGLRGDRRACELHCELCVLTISNGKNNWTNHVRTKRHQQALACAQQA